MQRPRISRGKGANRRQRRNAGARRLQFDSLEDRQLLAGLNVFVYGDADESGSWQAGVEASLHEQVVYLDQDGNGRLDSGESYAVTGVDGKATLLPVNVGPAIVRLFASSGEGLVIQVNDLNQTIDAELPGILRSGNRAPAFVPIDLISSDEDVTIEFLSEFLSDKVIDLDGDPLGFFLTSLPQHGSLQWSVDAGGRYEPPANYAGADSFSLRAFDGVAWSAPVSIDLSIQPVDDGPNDISLDASSIPENVAGFVIGPVTLDDVDGGENTIEISPEGMFEIRDGKLKLLDDVAIDFEQTPTVEFSLTAFSAAGPSTPITKHFVLDVLDKNDPPLDFAFDLVLRAEEFVPAIVFGTISVIDQDMSDRYSLIVDDPRFEIVDGLLKLKANESLVYAEGSTVEITVTAVAENSDARLSKALGVEVIQGSPPWQNRNWALDVNDDGMLSPIDVLIIINALNRHGSVALDRLPPPGSSTYVDVNGDRVLSPIDALILINSLNREATAQGSGGGEGESQDSTPAQRLATGSTSTESVQSIHAPKLNRQADARNALMFEACEESTALDSEITSELVSLRRRRAL